LSEPLDTFKDWIIAQLLFSIANHSGWSIALGIALVLGDVYVNVADLPSAQISVAGLSFQPSAAWPMAIPANLLLPSLASGTSGEPLICSAFLIVIVQLCISVSYFSGHGVNALEWMLYVWHGHCLSILAVYVIVFSHLEVFKRLGHRELQRTYLTILALSDTAATSSARLTLRDRMSRVMTESMANATSDARLLIAWTEDLPQGLLGFALVRSSSTGALFIVVSVLLSLVKGLVIPAVRASVFSWKWNAFKAVEYQALTLPKQHWLQNLLEGSDSCEMDLPEEVLLPDMEWYLDERFEMFRVVWVAAKKIRNREDMAKRMLDGSYGFLNSQGDMLQRVQRPPPQRVEHAPPQKLEFPELPPSLHALPIRRDSLIDWARCWLDQFAVRTILKHHGFEEQPMNGAHLREVRNGVRVAEHLEGFQALARLVGIYISVESKNEDGVDYEVATVGEASPTSPASRRSSFGMSPFEKHGLPRHL